MDNKKFLAYLIILILALISYLFLSIKLITIFFIEVSVLFFIIVFVLVFKYKYKFSKFNKTKKWFTLIELIISMTIISILSVGVFMSVSNFLKNNNDTIRKSHINQISLALKNSKWKLPLPDNYTSLYFSWSLIWFQWTFCDIASNKLNLLNILKDPENWTCYTYLINSSRNNYQLYTHLFTKDQPYIIWKDLWIVATTWNTTIDWSYTWSLDLYNASNNYKIYKNNNNNFISNNIKALVKNCNDIKKYNIWQDSWIYTVYSWSVEKKVYCNMEIKDGGWTLIVNVADVTTGWNLTWIDSLDNWSVLNIWDNWIFSRTWVNNLIEDVSSSEVIIKYDDGNYVVLDYYSWDIKSFYDGNYAVQISEDNCIANSWRCSSNSSENVSWWYFCNWKDPFFESYTFWVWWPGLTPDKSSYDCNNKIWSFIGIR